MIILRSRKGTCLFDAGERIVRRDDGAVRQLSPKAALVFQYLIDNSGRLVSQSELIEGFWTEDRNNESADKTVHEIRKALGDQHPWAYVGNRYGRGFHLLADLSRELEQQLNPHGACQRSETVLETGGSKIRVYAFDEANGLLATGGPGDSAVSLWDPDHGNYRGRLEGHASSIGALLCDGETGMVVSGAGDGQVRIWDVAARQCRRVLTGHVSAVESLARSRSGARIASGASDGGIHIWSSDGECVRVLRGHSEPIRHLAWSQDETKILACSGDDAIQLWHVGTGAVLRVFRGHTDAVRSVAWSADGRSMLSAGDDRTVRLWDVDRGKCIGVMEGHGGPVVTVAWTDHECYALSASGDRTVCLWNVATGRRIRELAGHTGKVSALCWQGRARAISGDERGCVYQWDLSAILYGGGRARRVATGWAHTPL
ncbi:MAG: winged helix-turn-helix domain-containing protein [Bryobacterales bacterium]|nr:winged helix-turn-helix domain-containing protein [Bryobacterales bacterium]